MMSWLLGCALFALASLAEHLPAKHVLWGEGGALGVALKPKSISTEIAPETADLEERDTACTNTPLTRNCWAGGYSVATDFDSKWPTTGRTVSVSTSVTETIFICFIADPFLKMNLEITNGTCNPDGNGAQECLLANNQYPGPTIIASKGASNSGPSSLAG